MNREPSNSDIYLMLGRLDAKVDGLRRDFEESEVRAREHRGQVYQKLEKQSSQQDRLEEKVTEMEPTVAGLTRLQTKAAGVILALGIVGAVVGAVLTYFADEIKAWIIRVVVR
ncbi:MAG: DUF1515 family protein [Rhizobiales bacterium]|nr:DUF1515 family protein [Hyphomicrobiales bacterium]